MERLVEGKLGLTAGLERGRKYQEPKKARPSGTHKLDQVISRESTRLAPPDGRQIFPVHLGDGLWPVRAVDSRHTLIHAVGSKGSHLEQWRLAVGIPRQILIGFRVGLVVGMGGHA